MIAESVPSALSRAEFSRIRFLLEFQDPFRLAFEVLLRLRRELQRSARFCGRSNQETGRGASCAQALFDPPLPADPVALRRFQRPGPPFAIQVHREQAGTYEAGDTLELDVVFWGDGIRQIESFATVLQDVGARGLDRGEGACELVGIESETPQCPRSLLWQPGEPLAGVAPPIEDALWWLENQDLAPPLVLQFLTPARLVKGGRPFFRPNFTGIFPFVLRRVTTTLYAHCGLGIVDDPQGLLAEAQRVETSDNRLVWQDWRVLEGGHRRQDQGGIGGSVRLNGEALENILWVLKLGTLLNLGKGAAYGAGRYRLRGPGG